MSMRLPSLRIEHLAQLAPYVTLLLVVLLAHDLARLTWRWLQPPITVTATPPTNAPKALLAAPDYQVLAQWHLFGSAPVAVAEVDNSSAPETRLNLRLVGVFHGLNIALIAEAGGEERRYRSGDTLPGGAVLEQVLERQVLLRYNGRRETLSLPKDAESSTNPRPNTTAKTTATPRPTANATARTIDASAVARDYASSLSGGDVQALQDLAQASPYVQNGQFAGFRLRPGRKRELLGQLGLQNGDVLTEVNGTRLTNPAQGLSALSALGSQSQLSLKVLRNGSEIPLTITLGTP